MNLGLRWAVRVDSSLHIGTGHLMRCLVLANQARVHGVSVEFICSDLPGHLGEIVNQHGFTLRMLESGSGNYRLANFDWERDASLVKSLAGESPWDWLVVDHYGIDSRWEAAMRPTTEQILVIDDLADRAHDCDVLVDQNYFVKMDSRYDRLVPYGCHKLLGPRFLLLRPEFKKAKLSFKRQIREVKRILISFGGSDETNVTCMALDAIVLLDRPDIHLDVVIGAKSSHRAAIENRLSALPQALLHVQTSRMADLIMEADIAIGACGSSTWERCYLGLPTLTLVLADNQRHGAAELNATGAIVNLGEAHKMTPNTLALAISKVIADRTARLDMSERSLALCAYTGFDVIDMLGHVAN